MSGPPEVVVVVDHAIRLLAHNSASMGELKELVTALMLRIEAVEGRTPVSHKRRRSGGGGEVEEEDEEDDNGEDYELAVLYAAHYKGQHVPPQVQQSWPGFVEVLRVELARLGSAVDENMWAKHQALSEVKSLKGQLTLLSGLLDELRRREDREEATMTRLCQVADATRAELSALKEAHDEAMKQYMLEIREKEREIARLSRCVDGHKTELAQRDEAVAQEAIKHVQRHSEELGAAWARIGRRDKRVLELEHENTRLRMIVAMGHEGFPPAPQQQQPSVARTVFRQPVAHVAPPHQAHPQLYAAAVEDWEGMPGDIDNIDVAALRQDMSDSPVYGGGDT